MSATLSLFYESNLSEKKEQFTSNFCCWIVGIDVGVYPIVMLSSRENHGCMSGVICSSLISTSVGFCERNCVGWNSSVLVGKMLPMKIDFCSQKEEKMGAFASWNLFMFSLSVSAKNLRPESVVIISALSLSKSKCPWTRWHEQYRLLASSSGMNFWK